MAIIYNMQFDQVPNKPFDEAYGPNPVTLSGIPYNDATGAITADKYVLQIYRGTSPSGTLVADLRQSPNAQGLAIFDIQNVLQNFVAPSPNNVEEIGEVGPPLLTSRNESVDYYLEATSETAGQLLPKPGETGYINGSWASSLGFLDFGGTKPYYKTTFTTATFIPALSQPAPNCAAIVKQAQPFSDMNTYRLGSEITDGKPAWLTDNMRVYDHYVTIDDMTTISYYNVPTGTKPAAANSIEAFVFWQYSGNSFLSVNPVYNVQPNGGGPNSTTGQGSIPVWPYKAITCGTGPQNFGALNTGSTTHYYVATAPYTGNACLSTITGLADGSMHYVHRFNIIEPDCNDFAHYQFSWLNSYGFRDYYTFNKRKDRSVNIARNEYLKEAADYNGTEYSVNIYDRGTTVYSQTLEETFTAFTDFISDAEALFLEGLFTSADVKVRFGDAPGVEKYQWVPVALLSTNWTEKTYRKDKLFQYDIRFKLAHNLKSQRG